LISLSALCRIITFSVGGEFCLPLFFGFHSQLALILNPLALPGLVGKMYSKIRSCGRVRGTNHRDTKDTEIDHYYSGIRLSEIQTKSCLDCLIACCSIPHPTAYRYRELCITACASQAANKICSKLACIDRPVQALVR